MAPTTILDVSDPAYKDFWIADMAPYSPPSLTINLVCRVLFGFLANLVIWVPFKLLRRNGEFAACVLIVTVMLLNLLTAINALIWRDDNTEAWWDGRVWCDVHQFLQNPLLLVYASSIFAIMRNLAQQMNLMRANALSVGEKRRRNLIQALIIFPLPLVQMGWIYVLSMHRFSILTLVGCVWMPYRAWPTVVFFLSPHPLFAIGSSYYAIITWLRFHEISKTTASALSSSTLASARARRAKRRLFWMTVLILLPYLPITFLFLIDNVKYLFPLLPFDFHAIHYSHADGFPWDTIIKMPSKTVNFGAMYSCYIPIMTALAIVWFFGFTKDAVNAYRKYMLMIGLGRWFPALRQEWDPDREQEGDKASPFSSRGDDDENNAETRGSNTCEFSTSTASGNTITGPEKPSTKKSFISFSPFKLLPFTKPSRTNTNKTISLPTPNMAELPTSNPPTSTTRDHHPSPSPIPPQTPSSNPPSSSNFVPTTPHAVETRVWGPGEDSLFVDDDEDLGAGVVVRTRITKEVDGGECGGLVDAGGLVFR